MTTQSNARHVKEIELTVAAVLSAKSLKEIAFSIAPSLDRLTCSQEQLHSMISAEDVTERRAMRAARASMCCFDNLALASFGR